MQGSPAEARIAAARRLIERRQYREALDVLNDAIRIDPRKTDSFQLRSLVFENLGLEAQAYADRQRAADLSAASPPAESNDEPEVAEEPEEEPVLDIEESGEDAMDVADVGAVEDPPKDIDTAEIAIADEAESPNDTETAPDDEPEDEPIADEPAPVRTPRVAPIPRYSTRPPREGGRGSATARGVGTALIMVGLLAAFGAGIYIAFSSVSNALDGGNDDGSVVGTSPTPGASEDASPSPTPDTPDDALAGSPLDFESLRAGWKSKSVMATPGDVAEEVTGFGPTAVTVTLSSGVEEMEVAVLLYESAQGISQDWNLGERPAPKAGRVIPAGATVWYNLNAVVVVIESNEILRPDARDGFLGVNA